MSSLFLTIFSPLSSVRTAKNTMRCRGAVDPYSKSYVYPAGHAQGRWWYVLSFQRLVISQLMLFLEYSAVVYRKWNRWTYYSASGFVLGNSSEPGTPIRGNSLRKGGGGIFEIFGHEYTPWIRMALECYSKHIISFFVHSNWRLSRYLWPFGTTRIILGVRVFLQRCGADL